MSQYTDKAGVILGMGSANERGRYHVMPSLIGRTHTQNDPCKRVSHLIQHFPLPPTHEGLDFFPSKTHKNIVVFYTISLHWWCRMLKFFLFICDKSHDLTSCFACNFFFLWELFVAIYCPFISTLFQFILFLDCGYFPKISARASENRVRRVRRTEAQISKFPKSCLKM